MVRGRFALLVLALILLSGLCTVNAAVINPPPFRSVLNAGSNATVGGVNVTNSITLNGSTITNWSQVLSYLSTGNVSGTGTPNTVPLWTGVTTLGNSALTQSGTTLTTSGLIEAGNLNVTGTAVTTGTPASASATLSMGGGTYYNEGGYPDTHRYKIYAYKYVAGVKVFTQTPVTAEYVNDNDYIFNPYGVVVAWAAVAGADGYTLLKYFDGEIDGLVMNYDRCVVVNSTTLTISDSGISDWSAIGCGVYPSVGYSNQITLNGQIPGFYTNASMYGDIDFFGVINFQNPFTLYGYPAFDANPVSQSTKIGLGACPTVTGLSNVCVGQDTMKSLSSGLSNTALGTICGQAMTTGSYNTLFGNTVLVDCTTCNNNVALGQATGEGLISGSDNVFIGSSTGAGTPSDGSYNTIIGGQSAGNSFGYNNVFIGYANNARIGSAVNRSVIVGQLAQSWRNDQFVTSATEMNIGTLTATPLDSKLQSADSIGTNIAGGNLTLLSGHGTGTGAAGFVKVKTTDTVASGSTAQRNYTRLAIGPANFDFNPDRRRFDLLYRINASASYALFINGTNGAVAIGELNSSRTNALSINGSIIVDGGINITADAALRFIGSATVWDDLTLSVANLRINPVTSKPDEDTDKVTYLFDDSTTECVRGSQQTSHKQKNNTPLYCHVHWISPAGGNVTWQMNYTLDPPGTSAAESWTVVNTSTSIFGNNTENMRHLSSLPVSSNIVKMSTQMRVSICRVGGDSKDTMPGDAAFLSFDCHYEMDKTGSDSELV